MQSLMFPARYAGTRRSSLLRVGVVMRRHPIAAYLAVAFGVSGTAWGSMAVGGQVVIPGGSATHFPGLFGPMVAALVVTAVAAGLPGLRDIVGRMFRWRTSPRWFALALLPLFLFATGVALTAITGGEVPTVEDLGRYSGLPEIGLPAVLLLALIGNGFGEEVGWRGFAHPTLRRSHGFLATVAMVGVMWSLWHVPSFPVVETYRLMGLAIVPVFVIGLGSGAVVFGWLYERSGGSILVVAVAHLSLNMATATAAGRGLPQAFVTTGIVAWAGLIVAGEVHRSGGIRKVFARLGRDMTIRLLCSRFGGGLGRSTAVITYRGRSSGRRLSTPVEFVRSGSQVVILVATPERKQWWRNVRDSAEVSLWLDGRRRPGRATVVMPPDAAAALAGYVAERPRAARAVEAGGLAVVVELVDAGR